MSAHKTNRRRRRGTAIVEQAIVFPLMILLFLGIFISGLGVFRYQQISMLAREGTAGLRSTDPPTRQRTPRPPSFPRASNVYTYAVAPMMVGLNPAQLTCMLTPTMTSDDNTATVTVTYYWVPESLFSPITFSSTSTMPITY